jgi:hypothetical protein
MPSRSEVSGISGGGPCWNGLGKGGELRRAKLTPCILLHACHGNKEQNPKHGQDRSCDPDEQRGRRHTGAPRQGLELEAHTLLSQDDNGAPAAIPFCDGGCVATLFGARPFLPPPLWERAANQGEQVACCGDEEYVPLAVDAPRNRCNASSGLAVQKTSWSFEMGEKGEGKI